MKTVSKVACWIQMHSGRASEGNAQTRELETTEDWVIPTGGGYFFAPSIAALARLSGDRTPA